MTLTSHQETVFLDRYSKRDKNNNPTETHPEQMWDRVSTEIANNDTERRAFRNILDNWRFVPGGRILAGAGTESEKTYYNCYVIPVETRERRLGRRPQAKLVPTWIAPDAGSDSRGAIFDTMATMVDIMSRGGGVGINWSVLRPVDSYLSRVSGTSSGPVGWMDVASHAVGEVIQGGSRRGAAMFMLNDWHPDVEKFIEAKTRAGKITNANISVAISDAFMDAVRDGKDWTFEFPDTRDPEYNTKWDGDLAAWKERGNAVVKFNTVRARDLWDRIVHAAHASGEPGVVFLDRYNKQSTAQGIEKIICVNPCGEQGLGAYSVCNLGSMNLAAYVDVAVLGEYGDVPYFMWAHFERDVSVAIRFLDNVIDKTHYSIPETRDQQMKLRRIGLGVMGLADALIKLGLRYGSSDAVEFTERVFQTMKDAAILESIQLADERGPAQGWRRDMWDKPYLEEYAKRHKGLGRVGKPLRNLFLLTQAPTGTTAALAGVNSGIEPYFAFEYTRKDRTGTHVIKSDIVKGANPDTLVTSNDVTPKQHLLMQAAVQNNIDSSVSKTINAPHDASVESVHEAYTMAYDLGLKGLAYYRDGSRDEQVLYRDNPNEVVVHNGGSLDKSALPVLAFVGIPGNDCPVCGSAIKREEGCSKCVSCSWSAC